MNYKRASCICHLSEINQSSKFQNTEEYKVIPSINFIYNENKIKIKSKDGQMANAAPEMPFTRPSQPYQILINIEHLNSPDLATENIDVS